ncbi:MAG TPA: ATP-binding cassette domain-containing protein [Dissulfurispiraceae bacterium]|nr:ATP-binding cassette domain-containing protein [Dissulfurispiraceae bacterium]
MGLSVSVKKAVKGFTLDVSWQIGNELAVLFGFSGSGKSLTLQLVAGLMKPDSGVIKANGTIYFDSERNISATPQQRSLGYVFQDLALFPHMTVKQNILFGAKGVPKRETAERYHEMIDAFYINDLEKKRPSEISGGQKQRVAFARALMRRPDVLLLDEPFSALDTPLRIEMRAFLKDLRKTFQVPVVLVTHDAGEAASLADSIIVYSEGSVIQSGPAGDVFNNPADERVGRLLSGQETALRTFCRQNYNESRTA